MKTTIKDQHKVEFDVQSAEEAHDVEHLIAQLINKSGRVTCRTRVVCSYCHKLWDENVWHEPRCCMAALDEYRKNAVSKSYFTTGKERIYRDGRMWVRLEHNTNGWSMGTNSLPAHEFMEAVLGYDRYNHKTQESAQECLDICAKHAGWVLVTRSEYESRHR